MLVCTRKLFVLQCDSMLCLKLDPRESLDMLRLLHTAGEKKLASRLEAEILSNLDELEQQERKSVTAHAEKWLQQQQQLITERK